MGDAAERALEWEHFHKVFEHRELPGGQKLIDHGKLDTLEAVEVDVKQAMEKNKKRTHTTQDGIDIKLENMSDDHLENAIDFFEERLDDWVEMVNGFKLERARREVQENEDSADGYYDNHPF